MADSVGNSNPLTGSYRLLSWENRDPSGNVTYPLGADALGYISYSVDGYVFVHIAAAAQHAFSSEVLFGGGDEETLAAARSQISYCGRYRWDQVEVVHSVEICSFPNWIGTEQRRRYQFREGNLLLSADGIRVDDTVVEARLVWQPVAQAAI